MRAIILCGLLAVYALVGPGGLPQGLTSETDDAAGASTEPSAALPSTGQPEMTPEDKADAEIGESAAKEVEKQFKIIKDSPEAPRVMGIIEQVRPFTERPHQTYQVKIIDSKAINAFALPGGYIYFTQGLLDAVESVDELAAVAGHEMSHVCLRHSRRLMSKDERYSKILGPIILAAILSDSKAVDPGAVAAVGSLIVQDALNHYGREAELEADQHAVLYLHACKKYNPVAVLTVVEGLARIEGGQAPVEMGVLQTHPLARERAAALEQQLQRMGVPIERRRVTKSLVATAAEVANNGHEIGEIRLNERVVFEPAAALDGLSPMARAQAAVDTLNDLLVANLQLLEVQQVEEDGRQVLRARGRTILTISPGDAAFHASTVKDLAQAAMSAIRLGFQEEHVERAY
jgi:hypothetical protein